MATSIRRDTVPSWNNCSEATYNKSDPYNMFESQVPSSEPGSPVSFVQDLARQVQLLACIKWLGEFHVLLLIPLRGDILVSEIAELAGVPAVQLSQVVRMTATAGFLKESAPNLVAHTPLSAAFVTKFSLLDAAMFLAERTAPTALKMVAATQLQDGSVIAYSGAFHDSPNFQIALTKQERLRRQWAAHRELDEDPSENIAEVLSRLNWRSLNKNACIVDVCSESTDSVSRLAELHPSLQFIVQMKEIPESGAYTDRSDEIQFTPDSRISVQRKVSTGYQSVKDAAVYLVLPTPLGTCHKSDLLAELEAHLSILRANPSAAMILAPPLLPEPGSVSQQIEATARSRDLVSTQLTDERQFEVAELVEIVNGVQDGKGHLNVVNKLRFHSGATAAVSVKYSAFSQHDA